MLRGNKRVGWGQQRRLEFIDFRLYWEGRINRVDLTEHFGISVPQASLDLGRYQEVAPHNLVYERREKVYLATAAFRPALAPEHSDSYLNQLLTVATGALAKDTVFIGWAPPTGVVCAPQPMIAPDVLLPVLRAIRHELTLQVTYQAYSHPIPLADLISPHAIFFDGVRWHTRAYSHEREAFCNFALGRLLLIEPRSKSDVDSHSDRAWNTFVEVKIEPHPDLTASQRHAVELDNGMSAGVAILPTRVALLRFLLRQLDVLPSSHNSSATHRLRLANTEKLMSHLDLSADDPDG